MSSSTPARRAVSLSLFRECDSLLQRVVRLARAHPYTLLILALGLIVRALLMPGNFGPDFAEWDLDASATLKGINIYATPLHGEEFYQYAYFPLFLYLELPMRWLSFHSAIPFTVLGKLPIVAGDLLAAVLIAAHLSGRRRHDGLVALGTALYFLNPLVLYNSAWYGRFDAVAVGLFLLAVRYHRPERPRSWTFPILYAVAVAAKTYPIFILPWLLIRERSRGLRVPVALAAVLGALSFPYLIGSAREFFYAIVLYIGHRSPSGETWQSTFLEFMSRNQARQISYVFLALFVAGLFFFVFTRLRFLTYCGVSILLFLLLSKVVYEQYFMWVLPFLIFDAIDRRSWAAGGLVVALSTLGMLDSQHVHPLRPIEHPVTIAAAIYMLVYILTSSTSLWLGKDQIEREREAGQ